MLSNATNMSSSGFNVSQSQGGTMGTAAAAMEFNREMMEKQQAYNAEEAQKNRDWQKMMSDTSYQRAVQDMVKAGINPILAASNGGAAMGSGGQAASGMASGMPEQFNSSSGYGENSAYSVSNWGLQLEALGQSLSTIFGGLFDLSGLGGNLSLDNISNSIINSAKTVMKDMNNRVRSGDTGAPGEKYYDRWLHGREWK